ncbi:MAG: hypothetical protein U0136_07025 [Bdellovibrionota bacterium]
MAIEQKLTAKVGPVLPPRHEAEQAVVAKIQEGRMLCAKELLEQSGKLSAALTQRLKSIADGSA